MNNSANEIITSLKGGLHNQTPEAKGQDNHAPRTHESDPQTLTLQFGSEEHTFPYTQIRHINRDKETINLVTYDAHIKIKGKNLEYIYSYLRRYKLSAIALSGEETTEEQQSTIQSISVTYDNEEDNHV